MVAPAKGNGKTKAPPAPEPEPQSDTNGNGEKRRPAQSYKCYSDGSTCLEVAIWPKVVEMNDSSYTQYSLTTGRSWRDGNGTWHDSGKDDNGNARMISFRGHDLPVLQNLIAKAYAWIMDQRTTAAF